MARKTDKFLTTLINTVRSDEYKVLNAAYTKAFRSGASDEECIALAAKRDACQDAAMATLCDHEQALCACTKRHWR